MALLVVILVLLGVPLALTVAAHAGWTPPPVDPDLGAMPRGTATRAFLGEWLAIAMALLVRPLRLRDDGGRRPGAIVFIPEVGSSSAAFWLLRRRLRRLGWASAGSAAAGSLAQLDAAAEALGGVVDRIAVPDAPLVLIGHGLGGLVALRYAATRGAVAVRHVVTLGTPHQGTSGRPYALLGAGDFSPAAVGLWSLRPWPSEVISIYSDRDPWLVPAEHAYCPGAFNITARGLAHWALLLSPRVAGLIEENLSALAAGAHPARSSGG